MTETKTDNRTKEAATAVIEETTSEPSIPLSDLIKERERYKVAYQQLLDNANANAGVIQWLSMQIEKLEKGV